MPLRVRGEVWYYRFWIDGQEYTASTGLAGTERNRNAAARAEAKARELVLTGKSHELKLEVRRFSDATKDFLAWADGEHAGHPNTAKRLHTSFVSLCAFFGNAPVSSILRGHVNDYKAWRRNEHKVRDITIRHDLHALSKAFGYWIDHNWARENPIGGQRGVEVPSDKDAVRIHVLTANEETVYFEFVQRYPALYDVGRLMLNQGCRPDEILNLKVEDIDLEERRLIVRTGKSAAACRKLRLTPESLEICARRVREAKTQWLFPGKLPGTRLVKLNGRHDDALEALATCNCGHSRDQHTERKRCCRSCAGFVEASRLAFVIYDLRHTFATRAAEAGMPVATLAAILGHADLRSVMKYVHVRQEAQDREMDRLSGLSGICPVESGKTGENAVSGGNSREALSYSKIN